MTHSTIGLGAADFLTKPYALCSGNNILVGGIPTPLKNDGVRQLG